MFLRKALMHFIDSDLGQNDEAVITSASGQIGFLQQLTDNKAVLRAAIDRIKARPYWVRDSERPLMTEYQALEIDRAPVAMNPNGIYLGDVFEYFVQRTMVETGEGREPAALHVSNRARAICRCGSPPRPSIIVPFVIASIAVMPPPDFGFTMF